MARTQKDRIINNLPNCCGFVPNISDISNIEKTTISPDEYQAIVFADYDGLSMKEAADRMGISAPTFCRILERAHKKVADSFVNNKGICFDN